MLKLAYESPLTGLHIAEAFAEADLPAGVLNVLTGRGSVVGAALVRDPRVRAISFTGSVATGNSVRDEATKLGKRVQLELGGHNPLIVMADADLDRAVEASYAGAFWSAGQKCTATRRIYVQSKVYDAFKELLLARIERGKVGDPADPDVEVGPIVNEKQFDEIMEAIERGKSEGGTRARRRRARRRGRLPHRADRVRRRRRQGVPLVRGSVRPRHVALPVRDARRSAAARERQRVRPVGGDLHDGARQRDALPERSARQGSSTSTRRPRAPTCTCRSAGSSRAASARTSRAAPRSSSTPRRSRSTSIRERGRAVPRHRRARLHRRVDLRRARR